jgi:AcrR family transcriptional regulator
VTAVVASVGEVTSPTPYPVAARELLRSTILDAVRDQLRTRPWADVTMAAVAAAAGVSRQTLYKEFGSRTELAQAYVLRETDRFLGAVEEAVTAHLHDPATALSAAFEVFLSAAAEDPLVRAIVAGDGGDELLRLVTTDAEPVLVRATERLASFLRRGWPGVGDDDARLLSDAVVRLAISYVALPKTSPAMSGRAVAALLGPYVERVLES